MKKNLINPRTAWATAGAVCLVLGVGSALAQSPVGLAIQTQSPGSAIPADFSGLSFGTGDLQPYGGVYIFDSSNSQMVTLLQQLGTRILRIGGSTVESYTPATADVDALFRFAAATRVSVIYSLPLEVTNSSQDVPMAGYIWTNYLPFLNCFAVGNEPEGTNFSIYFAEWTNIVMAITNAVPGAVFGGPDGASNLKGKSLGTNLAAAESGSGLVTAIQFHYYPGDSDASLTAAEVISEELLPTWTSSKYPYEYSTSAGPILPYGIPYRFTEVESFDSGSGGYGVPGGGNSFATALFALDFMHWWATNGCQAACFHTTWGHYNGVFQVDASGNYEVYPNGYGIKAFDLGGHGNVIPVGVTNTDGLDLTAYAVAAPNYLYVTVINKENGTNARSAAVTIAPAGEATGNVEAMFLTAPDNNAGATTGITLGGAPISDNGPWLGQWTFLGTLTNGQYTLTLPATAAAIFRISPIGSVVISSPPASEVVPATETATLSVVASGMPPLSYNWYFNGTNLPLATNPSLILTDVQPANAGAYDAVIRNSYGSVTSSFAILTVLSTPVPAPVASYPQAVLALKPVGYWRLNEKPDNGSGNQGVVCHDYLGVNNGVYSNVMLAQAGYNPVADPSGTAATFGTLVSSNSMASQIGGIDFRVNDGGGAEFTVSAWVKCAPQSTGGAIIAKGYGNGGEQFVLDFGAGGTSHDFRFFVRKADGAAVNANSTVQPDGNWHQVVGVCDQTNGALHLYVDGVDRANAGIKASAGLALANAGTAGLGDTNVSIGARTSSSTATAYDLQTVGTIDEVAVYNYALSSNQIQSLFAAAPIPAMNLAPFGTNAIITYTGTLRCSSNVTGPYVPVPDATQPSYVIPLNQNQMFYRASNP